MSNKALSAEYSEGLPINQIICGDNVETLATFPDDSIDLTVTSPPYDNLRTYGGHSWDFSNIAQQLWRVTKTGGVVVWVVGDATVNGGETGSSFRQALRFIDSGFLLHDTMIWDKTGPVYPAHDGSNRYSQVFEYMFVLSKGKPKTANLICDHVNKWPGGSFGKQSNRQRDGTLKGTEPRVAREMGYRFNIWQCGSGKGNATQDEIAFKHPAIFPESLASDHVLTWSNKGDIVLDPFSGSGTTAKMAKANNRRYIGVEVNSEYCEIADSRLSQGVFNF